jgi:hypothetical protein
MTDKQTSPNWVQVEAAKRSGYTGADAVKRAKLSQFGLPFRALCDMIEKYEQPPVDRKLLCAQAALTGALIELDASHFPKKECMWEYAVRAIELFEEGFGK